MDASRILTTIPPVVECIFRHLNWRDLDACSTVCNLWNRVAESEKNSREDLFWFFQGINCLSHNKIHSSCSECSEIVTRDIETELSQKLNNLKLNPRFCLAFATTNFVNDFEQLFPSFEYLAAPRNKRVRTEDFSRKRAYLKAAIETSLGKYLPDKCKTAFCVAPGVIGSKDNCEPLEIEDGCAISGLMLPYVPGLEIYSFPIDEKKKDISELVPAGEQIKCLLVFIAPYDSSCYSKLIESCLSREKYKVAVGGAIVDRAVSHSGTAIAFCGNSVDAASVVIKPTDKEAELEKKLKSFQETGLLQDKCFALMFACVARGYFVYREYNLESSIFHKLYPDVPLFGVFGNGEIGVEYLPNNASQRHPHMHLGKLSKCKKRHLHSYSSVFVLVSLKM